MSDESDDSSVVIKVVKLTTGEEIVGILINDSGKEYEISFPARVSRSKNHVHDILRVHEK